MRFCFGIGYMWHDISRELHLYMGIYDVVITLPKPNLVYPFRFSISIGLQSYWQLKAHDKAKNVYYGKGLYI